MSASALPFTETTNSDNPAAAKRAKFELDEDEDISIVEEIIVRPAQAAGGNSQTTGSSQLSDGEGDEDNQDSKVAEVRNTMLTYQAEVSHLRTQLKREQEKAQNAEREKVKADAVKEHYETKYEEERKRANEAEAVAQQKAADAEKKAKNLQKQCELLETKVQSKEAEIENRDKRLANAAKELIEAHEKAENAEKKAEEAAKKVTVTDAHAEAHAKKEAAEKEESDLKQMLEELKKSKIAAERKLNTKIIELENQLANTGAREQPSSSTDGQLGEELNEVKRRIAQQENEITKLRNSHEEIIAHKRRNW